MPEHLEAWNSFMQLLTLGFKVLADVRESDIGVCLNVLHLIVAQVRWTVSRLFIVESLHLCPSIS